MYGLPNFQIIAYKFDIEDEKACRLAFHGKIQEIMTEEKKK